MNDSLLLLINGFAGKNALLDHAMVFCAKYLVYIVFAIAFLCVMYLLYKKQWRSVIFFVLTLVVSYILLRLAALANLDHRPFMDHHLTQLVAHASGKSFPSDHTTVATAIALGLLVFSRLKRIAVLLLLCALIIGFSRIFVGIHYPLDIIGGLVTGAVGTLIVWLISRIAKKRAPHEDTPFYPAP